MKALDSLTQAYVLLLLLAKLPFREIAKLAKVSIGFVSTASKLGISGLRQRLMKDKGSHPGGRPRRLSTRDRRNFIRSVAYVRKHTTNFTADQVALSAGLRGAASTRTFQRELRRAGYRWASARRKGVLYPADFTRRVKFCSEMKTKPSSFWTDEVSFYLDGVSFTYKSNPYDNAACPRSKVWLRPDEKLRFTSKGKHEGTGGQSIKYMIGISSGTGVVICEEYTSISAKWMKSFVERNFNQAFLLGKKGPGRIFLQDNDPSQQSALATKAWKRLGFEQVYIPPRSPDLNPIENIFNLVKKLLHDEAIEKRILHESLAEFKARIVRAVHRVAKDHASKTIASMAKRCQMVIDGKGARIPY